MASLKDLALEIIKDFVARDVLFTALDVSNLVKTTMPYARHKEVRDIVREAWVTDIENNNYDRSPINVTLANGGTAEALLYHPMSASWDLDNLYSAQQRAQLAVAPRANTASTATSIQTVSGTLSKTNDGTLTVTTTPVAPLPVPAVAASPIDLWNQMWQTAPSLFPRKP
jgi:hypothetical protein